MAIRFLFPACLIVSLLTACSPTSGTQNYGADESSDLAEALIGEWRNVSLHITLNTANGTDETEEVQYNESNWEEQFGMKPARTFFQEDGSYYTEYRDLDDSVFQVAQGAWRLMRDSLIMEESNFTYRYQIRIKENTGEFKARVDGDEDGEWDDDYVEVQRKFK